MKLVVPVNDLQISSAAAQGTALGELGAALTKRVDDMLAMLEKAATLQAS
jgi:hypothetical protein